MFQCIVRDISIWLGQRDATPVSAGIRGWRDPCPEMFAVTPMSWKRKSFAIRILLNKRWGNTWYFALAVLLEMFLCVAIGVKKDKPGPGIPTHIACGLASAVVISGWPAIRRSSIYDGFGLRRHQLQDFIPCHFWHVWEVPVQDFHSPRCSMMLRISYNFSRFNRFTLASLLRSLDHPWGAMAATVASTSPQRLQSFNAIVEAAPSGHHFSTISRSAMFGARVGLRAAWHLWLLLASNASGAILGAISISSDSVMLAMFLPFVSFSLLAAMMIPAFWAFGCFGAAGLVTGTVGGSGPGKWDSCHCCAVVSETSCSTISNGFWNFSVTSGCSYKCGLWFGSKCAGHAS